MNRRILENVLHNFEVYAASRQKTGCQTSNLTVDEKQSTKGQRFLLPQLLKCYMITR